MAKFFEFIGNHWILSTLWVGLLVALILYQQAKAGKTVSPQEATLLVNRSDGVILDIRDKKDFKKGHIVDAIHIPLAKLKERLMELKKLKESPIIVVCQMGHQSGDAVKILQVEGFSQVSKLFGGIAEWSAQNLPLVRK